MKIMVITTGILIAIAILFVLMLLYVSPGKPKPIVGPDGKLLKGSISEKVFVNIGGVRQGMFIRGENIHNPLLLFVHGGPAFPEYFLVDKYPSGIEKIFTVCYWEQRGGGLSYSPEVTLKSMNLDQFTSDAIEVTRYLCQRFGKQKIYLLAHSGGTSFAIQAVEKAPELYHAYIGVGQITRQADSEKRAWQYMMEQFKKSGNQKAIEELRKYPVMQSDSFIIPFFKSMARDQYMHQLGIGTMRQMRSVLKGVFIPIWMCKAYTLKEKINIWVSKFSFVRKATLIEQVFALDIPVQVPELKVPVYFFSGKYDWTVNHDLSKAYLDQLKAPKKGFYTFENSAHSPMFEEPERFYEIMKREVIEKAYTDSLTSSKPVDN